METNHPLDKAHQVGVLLHQVPVQPANLVVLAISVVVAQLAAPRFVPINIIGVPCEINNTVRKFLIWRSRNSHGRIAGRPLYPAVPAIVGVQAILVVLAVCQVVLSL